MTTAWLLSRINALLPKIELNWWAHQTSHISVNPGSYQFRVISNCRYNWSRLTLFLIIDWIWTATHYSLSLTDPFERKDFWCFNILVRVYTPRSRGFFIKFVCTYCIIILGHLIDPKDEDDLNVPRKYLTSIFLKRHPNVYVLLVKKCHQTCLRNSPSFSNKPKYVRL